MFKRLPVLLALGLPSWPAVAQFAFPIEPFQIGRFPAVPSTRDPQYVGYIATCRETWSQPMPLQQTRDRGWVLTVGPLSAPCGTPPQDSMRLNLVALPDALPLGHLTVDTGGGEVGVSLRRLERIPPSAAGTWYDPAHSGQGVHFAQSPTPTSVPQFTGVPLHNDGFTLVWATFGPDGRPLWLTGYGSTGDFVLRLNMFEARGGAFPTRSAASEPVRAWGRVTLEYLGCGRMSMHWNALDDAAFPPGSLQLTQLTTNGAHPCDPQRYAREYGMLPNIVPIQLLPPESSR